MRYPVTTSMRSKRSRDASFRPLATCERWPGETPIFSAASRNDMPFLRKAAANGALARAPMRVSLIARRCESTIALFSTVCRRFASVEASPSLRIFAASRRASAAISSFSACASSSSASASSRAAASGAGGTGTRDVYPLGPGAATERLSSRASRAPGGCPRLQSPLPASRRRRSDHARCRAAPAGQGAACVWTAAVLGS